MGARTTFGDWIAYIIRVSGMSMLRGAGNTLIIAFVATAIGCLIGLVIGIVLTIPTEKKGHLAKRAALGAARVLIAAYVEVFRGTPMMAQAVFIYFGATMVFNINMTMWFAAFFIVSINTGAYMAETVRGGILSIDPGQTEGAKAIGMTHFQTMTSVILPQAMRNIMPQIGNNLIINIKDTCVLSAIGTVELMYASRGAAGANYRYFETYTITMAMYLAMTLFFSRVLRVVEKRMDGERSYDLATQDTLAHTSGMYTYTGGATGRQAGGGVATGRQAGGGAATGLQAGGGAATGLQASGGVATERQMGGGAAIRRQMGGGGGR